MNNKTIAMLLLLVLFSCSKVEEKTKADTIEKKTETTQDFYKYQTKREPQSLEEKSLTVDKKVEEIKKEKKQLKEKPQKVTAKSMKTGGSPRQRVMKKGIFDNMSKNITSEQVQNADPFAKGGGVDAILAGKKGLKRGGGGGTGRQSSSGIGFGVGTGSGFGGGSGSINLKDLSSSQSSPRVVKRKVKRIKRPQGASAASVRAPEPTYYSQPRYNRETYSHIDENSFMNPMTDPLSTVSIDVDNASYTNLRRMLNQGYFPSPHSIRVEECINYFSYDYPKPEGAVPFSVYTEVGQSPWNKEAKLLHIGLKGKEMKAERAPRSNLVFLLDVSGSMGSRNKLPLLKQALPLLVQNLTEKDRVSIVVYAGAAGMVLDATPGSDKTTILNAINNLSSGGSTAGGAGIRLAYKIAEENLMKGGNNRIILATDGDFNVGISSTNDLVNLMKKQREKGIALTVLGFGDGNYRDHQMEQIADRGNGNYFYIDNILEAKKVLVTEMVSTLHTIAKDVKLQIEFNPQRVKEYRLVGYVNRKLATKDFDDDTKDAGEMGAGHTVTALYEIIPQISKETPKSSLKYQNVTLTENSTELGAIKLRYKKPTGSKSTLVSYAIQDREKSFTGCSENFRFSAAVAEFILKVNSSKVTKSSWESIKKRAIAAKGKDTNGYRAELISLIDKASLTHTSSDSQGQVVRKKKPIRRPQRPNSRGMTGARSRANIMRIVRSNMASLKYAFNRRLKTKPGIKGKVTVKWAIDEFGNVLHCKVVKSTMQDKPFENEVVKKIKSWSFGQINIPGDVTEVTYPFVFTQ